MKKAIIIGATGAVGRDLLEKLLANPEYERVDVLVRRDIQLTHSKLHVHVINFDKPETWSDLIHGDGETVLFSCLGTTLKQAGGQQAQWRVDHDYQLEMARIAAAKGVPEFVLVSSIGANERSANFYLRMKGTLETEVKALAFKHITILQPPSLIRKNSDRWAEKMSVSILQALNRCGIMKSMTPMPTETVADCMIRHAGNGAIGTEVIVNQDIINR